MPETDTPRIELAMKKAADNSSNIARLKKGATNTRLSKGAPLVRVTSIHRTPEDMLDRIDAEWNIISNSKIPKYKVILKISVVCYLNRLLCLVQGSGNRMYSL